MHPITDTAVVLRTFDLGEADRIITLLCHEHGIVRGVAKAVRKTRSKFGSRLEPFTLVEVKFVPSRRARALASGTKMSTTGEGLAQIRGVSTIESFASSITSDWPSYTAACTMMETAEHLAGNEPRIMRMLVLAFRSLAAGTRNPALVADAFMLRTLQAAGWEPVLRACARCGTVGPHRAYHVPSGGSVCVQCRPPGSLVPRQGTIEVLEGLLRGDWTTVEAAPEVVQRQAEQLVTAHVQWHLERQLRTLPLMEHGKVPSHGTTA